ncbi:9608_t:CDS:2, partial [Racocetra fulgida]
MNFKRLFTLNNTVLNIDLENNSGITFDSLDADNNSNDNNKALDKDFNDVFDRNLSDNETLMMAIYYAYAIKHGFTTRLDRTERILGFLTRAEFVCRHVGAPSNKGTGLQTTKSVAM